MNTQANIGVHDGADRVGTIFYDSSCSLCTRTAQRLETFLARRGFCLTPLQALGTAARLGIRRDELLQEMRFQLRDGSVYSGAEGVVEIARRIWWGWPLWGVSRLPGAMPALRGLYRRIADNRACANGVCENNVGLGPAAYLPLLILPLITFFAAARVPRWIFMWSMAFALYASCKWLSYRDAVASGARANLRRALGFLFAWPGMDASTFLGAKLAPRPKSSEWMFALAKTLFGATLFLFAAASSLPIPPLARGWLGMIGAVFFLHFGTFHLLSVLWRSAGVDAKPVMLNPARSISLSDFWGRRWNTAFHELASRFTFRPLRSRLGSLRTTFFVFLVSGLIHELVISVPAQGDYGLPTGYFVLQAAGIAAERSRIGRAIGLGKSWRGWLFTMLLVVTPAFWLFHPLFVQKVMLPMLQTVGQVWRNL